MCISGHQTCRKKNKPAVPHVLRVWRRRRRKVYSGANEEEEEEDVYSMLMQ